MQHKWHKEIKAWADGAEIEWDFKDLGNWHYTDEPQWHDPRLQFRIKPTPKEPQYLYVYYDIITGQLDLCFENEDIEKCEYIGKIKLED